MKTGNEKIIEEFENEYQKGDNQGYARRHVLLLKALESKDAQIEELKELLKKSSPNRQMYKMGFDEAEKHWKKKVKEMLEELETRKRECYSEHGCGDFCPYDDYNEAIEENIFFKQKWLKAIEDKSFNL